MITRFSDYQSGFRIVSLALDEATASDLMSEGVSTLFVTAETVALLPEKYVLTADTASIACLRSRNNYDVLELWPDGSVHRLYDNQATDNYFFVTGKCNSNCIMCPSPDAARKNAYPGDAQHLIEIASHIPQYTNHLTITGGEPFMLGESIFSFFRYLREKFQKTQFLLLTNGRIFASQRYFSRFLETVPQNCVVAIPLHGSSAQIHDGITRSADSFDQTVSGIKHLIHAGIRVELRIVVSRMNADDMLHLAELICKELYGVAYVSFIAMEMTGNARLNRDQVWIPYNKAFEAAKAGIAELLQHGIDVKLYNFPLCTVSSAYRSLCEKSISPNKVRFAPECTECREADCCGGIFAGTINLERDELKPII